MKITFALVSALLLFISTSVLAQTEAGIAYDKNGKVIYIESFPATQYRHLGTVTCSSFSPDKVEQLIDHMLKQTVKQFPDQEFDAIIFRQGSGLCKADIVQFYRDPKAKKSRSKRGEEDAINPAFKLSKANAREDLMLFIKNSPTAPNTLLGKVELPVTFKSTDLEEYISEMIQLARNTYPDLQGIVIIEGTNFMKANVIKFK